MDREHSAAYAAMTLAGRRVLPFVEHQIEQHGDGIALSLSDLMAHGGGCRSAIRYGVRQLQQLGFVTIGQGPRRVHVFSLAGGWRSLDADEAARRVATARVLRASKRTKRVTVKPPQPVALFRIAGQSVSGRRGCRRRPETALAASPASAARARRRRRP